MLTVPALTEVDGITVYRDDTHFNRFYALPPAPRVRVDTDGRPAFGLLAYALSDEDRAAHPELGGGGGYLTLDTEFAITDADRAKLTEALRPFVVSEWERLRAGTPEERARPGAADPVPPAVEFGTPTYTSGAVKLDAPATEALVRGRVAEGQPSLLAGNTAVFSLDLTPGGAALVERTIRGDAALVPLQVAYELTFWARLPEVGVHLEVDAQRMHEYITKQLEGRGTDNCTTYDFDHTTFSEEALQLSGAVRLTVDNGSGSVPEEVVAELRGYALDTLKALLQNTFFVPEPPEDPNHPDRLPNHRYFQKDFDKNSMSIRLDLQQHSVVPWKIAPRGALTTLLGEHGDPDAHIRKVTLDDDFFADLRVEAEVFTDYTDVGHVEVELSYAGRGELLVFTAPGPKTWTTPLAGGEREYEHRHRVVFKDGRSTPFTPWQATSHARLAISPPPPGRVGVDVLAGAVDFDQFISSVQVTLAYEDTGVPREEHTLVLTKASPSGRYERVTGTAVTKPVRYRTAFVTVGGERLPPSPWQPVAGSQVLVNQPTEALLRVTLVPTGNGWADVAQVMVELHSDAAYGHPAKATIPLRGFDEGATWVVPLADAAKRSYRHRWTASFTNGQLESTPWREVADGDAVLPVLVDRAGIDVTVIGDALDFTACPLTEVSLASAGVEPVTFLFRDKAPQRWHIDVPEGTPVDYTWSATHYPTGRDPIALPARRETDPFVVLPAYQAAVAGELRVQVLASLVDFAATPVVGVDLRYSDPANDLSAATSMTLEKAGPTGEWVLPIKDRGVTGFDCRITYYGADGAEHAGEWTTRSVPRVIVPARRA